MKTYQEYLAQAEHYKAIDWKTINLHAPYGEDDAWLLTYPWQHVISMRNPDYHSGCLPNDPFFTAEIDGLTFIWDVDLYDGSRADRNDNAYRFDRLITIASLLPTDIRAQLCDSLTDMLKTYFEDVEKAYEWYNKAQKRFVNVMNVRDSLSTGESHE